MREYSISEVTQIVGISRATVLYYESKGLIRPRYEEESGYRKYTMEDISQMMFYQSLKPLGISVEEYADAGKKGKSMHRDVFDLILLKKAEYMKRLSFYIAMWEETMAYAHILRNKTKYYQVMSSREAWALKFEEKMSRGQNRVLKNWHNHFLQRNLSYFFTQEKMEQGDFSYQQGLTCYADCAVWIDEEVRSSLTYIPVRTSLLMAVSVQLDDVDFEYIFDMIKKVLEQERLTMCGNPWGNIGYRDERPDTGARDYLFLWIPVET